MKARIRKKTDAETVFERMHCDLIKKYYDEKTGKLKNETEIFNMIIDNISLINRARQTAEVEKFIYFEPLENEKYHCYDEFNDNCYDEIICDNLSLIKLATETEINSTALYKNEYLRELDEFNDILESKYKKFLSYL